MSVIDVKALRKSYAGVPAVDGIEFAVEEGEIFGLLGPNGAGKTTTIEMIEGLRPIDAGEIRLLGYDVRKDHARIKETIGVQLQATAIMDRLTIKETLELFASFYKIKHDPAALIRELNLEEKADTLSMNLSGGQKQRLGIALALINDPQVVFLDEPTTGLDPQARRSLWEVIGKIRARGKTVMLTTHYMEEAEQLCDRVAIMDHGKILALDSPQTLISTYFRAKTIEVMLGDNNPPGEAFFRDIDGVENFHADPAARQVLLYTADAQQVLTVLLKKAEQQGVELKDLRIRIATLEDVFLKLTGTRIRE